MQKVTDRRTFVRNVVVGLPVAVGVASLSPAIAARAPHDGAMLEPPLESMLRDLTRLHNQMRRRPPTADDGRALAAHLQSLAAYQRGSSRDAQLTRNIRDAIERHGLETIVAKPADPERMRLELIAFGFDAPLVGTTVVSYEERAEALERLARSGLAPTFAQSGDALAIMDLIYLTAGPSSCEALLEMHRTMEVVTAVMCSVATVLPLAAPDCFAAATVLAALKLLLFLKSC